MRELTTDDLGLLLSLFAVLLLAFAANFHFSRQAVHRHRKAAIWFVVICFLGELSTVIALVLTWVAVWSPAAWDRIDNMLVFVPGSIAMVCAVLLTIESVYARSVHIVNAERQDARGSAVGVVPPPDDDPDGDDPDCDDPD
ncbi:hypothetical protein [Gordonia sp. (in: high G+C Gram-positive bacteria)]|uniref:hypothetical protein n=1 Tax=Gordonia sp. (in: high G+C Gram-positive bacteria) TaxID=84139 RepID=UPI003C725B57